MSFYNIILVHLQRDTEVKYEFHRFLPLFLVLLLLVELQPQVVRVMEL